MFYKLREAFGTGNPDVATSFMADNSTHQALPAQYVLPGIPTSDWGQN